MEVQGYVVIALAVLLLGYLLPHLVRSRQIVLDSRAEDRFSAELRVLATAGTAGTDAVGRRMVGSHHRGSLARPYLHQQRSEAPAVNRPTTRSARAVQDARTLAAARAARAADISRRAAAARRRLILTLALLAAAVGAWVVVATTGVGWWLGAVPSLLLLTVLVLGRRAAVVAGQRDAVARAEMAELEQRLRVVGRRAAPRRTGSRVLTPDPSADGERSSIATSSAAEPVQQAEAAEPVQQAEAAEQAQQAAEPPHDPDGGAQEPAPVAGRSGGTSGDETVEPQQRSGSAVASGWTPVPVPLPTYTLKPTAPRREVSPYRAADGPDEAAVPHRPTEASPRSTPRVTPDSGGLDVEAVLARRRAAGA